MRYGKASSASSCQSLVQTAFLAQCRRARQIPCVAPSDQALEECLLIINLYMPEKLNLTKPKLQELEVIVDNAMYSTCLKIITESPTFNQLISTLQLTAQNEDLIVMQPSLSV